MECFTLPLDVTVVADYKVDIPIPRGGDIEGRNSFEIFTDRLWFWSLHSCAVVRADAECGTLCRSVTGLTSRMNVTVLLGTN
jgi:hypothetical protein